MIEYSEYKSLVDILEKSDNHENTYQDVMKKENKVLDTVNRVIKHYRDADIHENEFINMKVSLVVFRFFNVWIDMFKEIQDGKSNILDIVKKDDRLIYIGVMCVLLSVFLYYVEITKSK